DDYIPIGFYLYVTEPKDVELGRQIIDAVSKVTPITKDTEIFGEACDRGLIISNSIPTACQAFAAAHADIAMTTEIYPDMCAQPQAQDGQLAAVRTSIEYML